MLALVAALVDVIVVLVGSITVRVIRHRAESIEHQDAPTAERAHRLRRLLLRAQPVVLLMFMLTGGTAGGLVPAARHRHGDQGHGQVLAVAALCGLGIVLALGLAIAVGRVVRPSLARVRGTSLKTPMRFRQVVVTVVVFALFFGAFFGARAVLPEHGWWHAIGVPGVYFLLIVALQAVLAPLIVLSFRAAPLPEATRQRLRALADKMGARVRDVRAFPGRDQKVANAAALGLFPGLRYVLVTDYLLDELSDEQVDAVVAHEFGHVRRRHVLVKLVGVLVVWLVLEALFVGASNGLNGAGVLLLIPLAIAFPVGMVLVNGLLGVRLEKQADDAAAAAVGADAVVSALDRIAELNHAKRDTGKAWSVLTQHPGMNARMNRLRAGSAPGPLPAPAPAPAGKYRR